MPLSRQKLHSERANRLIPWAISLLPFLVSTPTLAAPAAGMGKSQPITIYQPVQTIQWEEKCGECSCSAGLSAAKQGMYFEAIEALIVYRGCTRDRTDYYKDNPRWEGVALGNLGNAFFAADLYSRAIELHQVRLKLERKIKNPAGEAKALGDLGIVYQALGDYPKAIEHHQQQLAIARQIQDLDGQKMALANLGVAYHSLGDYKKAIDLQQQRLELARQTKDLKAEAEAVANLAGAYYFLGDYNQAIALYEQAWNIGWKNNLQDVEVLYLPKGNQGLAHFQQGDLNKALELYQLYYRYVASRNNRRGEGVAKNNAAVVRWQQGDLVAAEKALREAIERWESLRSRLGSNDAYKVTLFETQQAPYLNLQMLLLQQNKPEAALEIAERGRSQAFLELLRLRAMGDVPPAWLAVEGKPPNSTNSIPFAALIKKIAVPPVSIEQIKQTAKAENATLVEYSVLPGSFKLGGVLQSREAELLIWVVQPTGQVALRRVDLKPLWQQNTSLNDLVVNSRESIGVGGRGIAVVGGGDQRGANKRQQLQQLHQLLIDPIADLLPKDPNARVVFIPQRPLFLVPFAALPDANGKYLIEKHTISIAPSIQVLEVTRKQRLEQGSPPTPLGSSGAAQQRGGAGGEGISSLIVGNPTMPKVTLVAGQPPEQLASLPGAEREAKAIATFLNTQAVTGDRATKAAVLQQMTQAKLIHLATHGLLDDFTGLGIPGAIALAPAGKDDGLLSASEILNLKLKAELVVLSACDTGRGKLTGDGVVGLSRSLIVAGVPSVIVSLWSVPDAPTAALMMEFYQQLKTTPNKAVALRQAMLITLKQYPNPRDWAAFTLVGEP
jgi:CHAT domain-containing protein/tetratricopeptide (TPR) repeat protein